jgi:uncharacterized protein involved in cysteine biosynthesis
MAFETVQLYPWQYLKQGVIASKEIPGLRAMILKALLINGLLLFIIAAGVTFGFYYFAVLPTKGWLEPRVPDWLHLISVVLFYLVLAAVALISSILAVRISFVLLGVWYENLAEKVITFHRPLPDLPFRLSEQVHSLGLTLFGVAREIFVAVSLLILSFIPLIGPVLVFFIGGHWSGRGIIEPYLTVLKNAKQPTGELSLKPSLMTLSLGAIQVLLALIPLVGWILLPFVMVHQVIGLAYAHETQLVRSQQD